MTPTRPKKPFLFLLITLACLVFLLGMWVHHNKQKPHSPTLTAATLFAKPRHLSPFRLLDDQNKAFTLSNLKGHYNLLFFGFTHCPALCPTTLSLLNQAYQLMQHAQLKPLPQVVFISVDPEQDTPAVMKRYLSSFNPAFIGVTGSKDVIDQLTQEMSVLYAKVQTPTSHMPYTIDHSGTLLLINPKGQFAGVFTTPLNAKHIAQDMQLIVTQRP